MIFNPVLSEIFSTKKTKDLDGRERITDDMIGEEEAGAIYKMFKKSNAKTTIEVGLAHGVSALVFCQAHAECGNQINSSDKTLHFAIDPNQFTTYSGAAVAVISKAGYSDFFKVLDGPSHIKIPELIEAGIKVDCAFIDGWHTFDYTLVDFFLIDKILKPGGYIAFHDCYGRAKQKVINFILTHRRYSIDEDLMHFSNEKFTKVLKFFIWRIYKDPMLLFSWFHWKYQLKSTSGLLIMKKEQDFEPPFNFYKSF